VHDPALGNGSKGPRVNEGFSPPSLTARPSEAVALDVTDRPWARSIGFTDGRPHAVISDELMLQAIRLAAAFYAARTSESQKAIDPSARRARPHRIRQA
jgi:hypothetical protein